MCLNSISSEILVTFQFSNCLVLLAHVHRLHDIDWLQLEHCSFEELCGHFEALLAGSVSDRLTSQVTKLLHNLSQGENFAIWEDLKCNVEEHLQLYSSKVGSLKIRVVPYMLIFILCYQ